MHAAPVPRAESGGQRFAIRGRVWDAADAGLQEALAVVHGTSERPRCLCVPGGVEMYVARLRQYVIKRLPNGGSRHHPSCDSFEPEDSLSGLGTLAGSAVLELDSGRTELRVDFPWTRRPGRSETHGVATDGGQVGSAARRMPALTDPLVPRNVPWFTVRAGDFANPELARQIMEAYGEDRGEGRHLYRFPVIFPSDHWQTVMPHELAAWGASDKRYWSQYSPDGKVRRCVQFAPVPVDDTGRRTVRIFGGRKVVPREARGGLCEPESCPEYQQRECNLTGRFVFFIPRVRALSAFELQTTSFYAMNAAVQKFQAVAFLRGGRISGLLAQYGVFALTGGSAAAPVAASPGAEVTNGLFEPALKD